MIHSERRKRAILSRGINIILDVGANIGQFATGLRAEGWYEGRIVSFEPLSSAFSQLSEAVKNDPAWECHNLALGDRIGKERIHISKNSFSSSFLDVKDWSLAVEPSITYVDEEIVDVSTLDIICERLNLNGNKKLLKIDTQGYELNVLNGCRDLALEYPVIQLETSFRPVYEGEPHIGEVIQYMFNRGFKVISIEDGWENAASGELLQADILFST